MAAAERPRIVTLTTDFGLADGYVGQVKGAILAVRSDIQIVDLTHAVPAGRIDTAAYVVETGRCPFPAGTVHVVVVDPGVGGRRRALAGLIDGQFYVGPDNGVLSRVIGRSTDRELRRIDNPAFMRDSPSATFHGRDIFGPTAAHLACGASFAATGPRIDDPVLLARAERPRRGNRLTVPVVHVDHFGNVVLDLRRDELDDWLASTGPGARVAVTAGAWRIDRVLRSYADAGGDEPFLLFNSADYLEIACAEASAERTLGIDPESRVVLTAGRQRPADVL